MLFQDLPLDTSLSLIGVMFGAKTAPAFPLISLFTWKRLLVLLIALPGVFPLLPALRKQLETRPRLNGFLTRFALPAFQLLLLALAIAQLVSGTYNPFIYYRF